MRFTPTPSTAAPLRPPKDIHFFAQQISKLPRTITYARQYLPTAGAAMVARKESTKALRAAIREEEPYNDDSA